MHCVALCVISMCMCLKPSPQVGRNIDTRWGTGETTPVQHGGRTCGFAAASFGTPSPKGGWLPRFSEPNHEVTVYGTKITVLSHLLHCVLDVHFTICLHEGEQRVFQRIIEYFKRLSLSW